VVSSNKANKSSVKDFTKEAFNKVVSQANKSLAKEVSNKEDFNKVTSSKEVNNSLINTIITTTTTKQDSSKVVFNKDSSKVVSNKEPSFNKANQSFKNKPSLDALASKVAQTLTDVDSADQAASNNKASALKLSAKELWDHKLLTKESLKPELLMSTSALVLE